MGPRVAVSAAALGEDVPQDGQNLISSMLDGLCQDAKDSGSGAIVETGADWLMDLWGWVLASYSNGAGSIASGVGGMLDSVSGSEESALGSWATGAFTGVLTSLGLEPAKLSSPKPLTINTQHVLAEGNQSLAAALQAVRAVAVDSASTESFDFETLGRLVHIDVPGSTESPLPVLDEILEYIGGR